MAEEAISILGDPCTAPLAKKLAEAFTKKTGKNVEVEGASCGSGIYKASQGNADIGVSTHEVVLTYLPAGTVFLMPRIEGMKVDATRRVADRLAQPAKLRRNPRDGNGSEYHLNLTRFNDFRVVVPVILAEIDEPTGDGVTSVIGCI